MADVPKDLLHQIKEFEDIFTVGTEKLKEVVAHFVKELEKGTKYFLLINYFGFIKLLAVREYSYTNIF